MLERKALQSCKLAESQRAAAAGVDHAGAGGGHAAGELVAVLDGAGVRVGGADVVVGPVGGDVGDGVVEGCPWFEAGFERVGGVGGWGEGGEGFAGALGGKMGRWEG